MANPKNVEPFGRFLHYVAENFGTPENFMRAIEKDKINSYIDGENVGESRGIIKGIIITGSTLMTIGWIIDGVNFYKKHKKNMEGEKSKDPKVDANYIEHLLHLKEHVAEIVDLFPEVVKYRVDGRVVRLKVKNQKTKSVYDADIVFTNDGHYRWSSAVEDDFVVVCIANDILRKLEGKYVTNNSDALIIKN